jgi:hypothetical protein
VSGHRKYKRNASFCSESLEGIDLLGYIGVNQLSWPVLMVCFFNETDGRRCIVCLVSAYIKRRLLSAVFEQSYAFLYIVLK